MMGLGGALRLEDPEEALLVLEAHLALTRRHWSHHEESILKSQNNLAITFTALKRHDEALVLHREIYSRRVATLGVSNESTIISGGNMLVALNDRGLSEEAKVFARDQLLPAALKTLGADHDLTLQLNESLAAALYFGPERTRDDLRLNRCRSGVDATIQHRRRPSRSRDHPAARVPEATAGLRPRASGHPSRREKVVLHPCSTRPLHID